MRGAAGRGLAALLLIPAVLATCTGAEEDPRPRDLSEGTSQLTVEEMGTLGARVYAEPERAEELVAEAGLTPREYEERIRAITDDPGRSLTYARAFEEETASLAGEAAEGGS